MTDALVTAVENVITRVLIMQAAVVPEAVSTSRRWALFKPGGPYWVNRPGQLARPAGAEDMPTYTFNLTMRLVLVYFAAAHREDAIAGSSNAQDKAWSYVPGVVRYFEQYNLLNPPDYDPIAWVGRCSIFCPQGVTLQVLPLVGASDIYFTIDYELTVPITIGQEVT